MIKNLKDKFIQLWMINLYAYFVMKKILILKGKYLKIISYFK